MTILSVNGSTAREEGAIRRQNVRNRLEKEAAIVEACQRSEDDHAVSEDAAESTRRKPEYKQLPPQSRIKKTTTTHTERLEDEVVYGADEDTTNGEAGGKKKSLARMKMDAPSEWSADNESCSDEVNDEAGKLEVERSRTDGKKEGIARHAEKDPESLKEARPDDMPGETGKRKGTASEDHDADKTRKRIAHYPSASEHQGKKRARRHRWGNGRSKRPKSVNKPRPADLFWDALFGSASMDELARSSDSSSQRNLLMEKVCGRAGVNVPKSISASCDSRRDFYASRASLVLEDARCVVAEVLQERLSSSAWMTKGISVLLSSVSKSKCESVKLLTFQKEMVITKGASRRKAAKNKSKARKSSEQSTKEGFFESDYKFTPEELDTMRPGNCFLLTLVVNELAWSSVPETRSLLASIVPLRSEKLASTTTSVSLRVYDVANECCDYFKVETPTRATITPLTSVISHLRQFEACYEAPNVAFMDQLLATKAVDAPVSNEGPGNGLDADVTDSSNAAVRSRKVTSTIQRGGCGDNDEQNTTLKTRHESGGAVLQESASSVPSCSDYFLLPRLNETQDRAMKLFLNAPRSTLSLVQGPPGTGKTTWLVSVLAHCLMDRTKRIAGRLECTKRIVVTAPTNKAISVLASRFLRSMNSAPKTGRGENDDCPFRVVLIGVEEMLVGKDKGTKQGHRQSSRIGCSSESYTSSQPGSALLRRHFVYTWVEELAMEYQTLLLELNAMCEMKETRQRGGFGKRTFGTRHLQLAKRLHRKMLRQIPTLASELGIAELANESVAKIQASLHADGLISEQQKLLNHRRLAVVPLKELVAKLQSVDRTGATEELLNTANVIFCTLCTSGVSAMKRTRPVDDLLVDEAAASTEAEICIPFQLEPQRMLAVGDPRQLPSLVISPHAVELGLARSLHERLMRDCGVGHIMLDTQYRMKPQIAEFPSRSFYAGALKNGENLTAPAYVAANLIRGGVVYELIQVDGHDQRLENGSVANISEAKFIVRLVQQLRMAALQKKRNRKLGGAPSDCAWCSPDKLRIITFYQGQVSLIRDLLANAGFRGSQAPLVATVDSSQGCEADVVFVSFVRSNSICCSSAALKTVRRATGFLTDDKRLNVALTRARHQLICVGNALGTLRRAGSETMRSLVEDAIHRKCLRNGIGQVVTGAKLA